MSTDYDKLQAIGKSAADCIAEMVAALECDYNRLEELRTIPAGTEVSITAHASKPGKGLSYGAMEDMTLAEDCNGTGWDVVELHDADGNEVSVYSFSVVHPDAEELAELAEAAGDCESREDAERHIHEDPLSIEVRGDWYTLDGESDRNPVEFCILLGTGGPATRIVGDLDGERQPFRCHIESQDWGTQWTEYTGDRGERDYLLTYCQQFYFGE